MMSEMIDTVEKVRALVADIAAEARDDEAAHCDEDSLHQAVLYAISQGAPNAAELAEEALKTGEIEFFRWCA